MNRPIGFFRDMKAVPSKNNNEWVTLYYSDRTGHEPKIHPLMKNFEYLKNENDELKKRIEELEKRVDEATKFRKTFLIN